MEGPPVRSREGRHLGPELFTCVKCGGRFPLARGNALASGLACTDCTPQPAAGLAEVEGRTRPLVWRVFDGIADFIETAFRDLW